MGLKSLGPQQEPLPGLGSLTLQGWNIPSRQAGTKDPNRNKDLPSLLQKGRENPVHDRTFIWCELINRSLHPTIGNGPRSYPPIHTCDAAGRSGYHTPFHSSCFGEVSRKQVIQGFLLGLRTLSGRSHQGSQPSFRVPTQSPV